MIRAGGLILAMLLFAMPATVVARAAADSTSAISAAIDSVLTEPDDSGNGIRLFPPRMRAAGWGFLPKASHSTETGVGLGGQIFRPFAGPGADDVDPASLVLFTGRLTTKGQKMGDVILELSPGDGTYSFKSRVRFSDLRRRFWGIGPGTPASNEEVYRPEETLGYIEAFRSVSPHLKAGLRFEYNAVKYLEVETGGLLDSVDFVGTAGDDDRVLGGGLLVEFDTRDNRRAPTSGMYYQAFGMIFDEAVGSQYNFNNYAVDLRNFYSPSTGHVFATQVFFYSAQSHAPIWRYAELGGRTHTRGYRQGRYRDHFLLAFQGEYRIDLWWRAGLVAFGGLGDVGPSLSGLELEHMRPTIGGGLRFRVNDVGLKARLDAAFGQSSMRLYFSIGDAF